MLNNLPDLHLVPDQAHLEADLAKIQHLENLARQLAASHMVADQHRVDSRLMARLQDQEILLRAAHHYFAHAPAQELILSHAAEWLLDNFYVVQQALRQIREDMPQDYYDQLPKLATSTLAGYPRVYAIAWEIIQTSTTHLELERVRRFVQAYQQVAPLTMGELWALPPMLRLGILEHLTQAIGHLTKLPETDRQQPFPTITLSEEVTAEVVVANCILSLRMLATQDWQKFFESVSQVEQTLRRDPVEIYARMDFETRDRYRKVVEAVALATQLSEAAVAGAAVQLAQEASPQPERQSGRTSHVGYYLLEAGRIKLEDRLNYSAPWPERLRRWLGAQPTLVYLGSIGFLTLIFLLALLGYGLSAGGSIGQLIGLGSLTLIPVITVAVSLVNWLITHILPPRVLPKMDFAEGIPAEFRTMVVVPTLLTNPSEVQSLLQQLELHFLRNSDPHLCFALLTDLADAPQQHLPGDEVLLEQTIAGIQALNDKYRQQATAPFYLFHRERLWNPGEACWMGWERKRGKLHEFNQLLRGSQETSYRIQVGDLTVLVAIKYVITLDADTILPKGSAGRLVATLAHPLNQADFDPISGAVSAGYTVLQPRTEIKPVSANRSLFSQIFAGDTGLDLYTLAVSDIYQDLFGEGIYVGKGIYDVDAFERSLAGRVPPNTLLSHDLFEGISGRAGLVTDIVLYEDYPPHYLVHVHRAHRWVRGDWQLLPWLLPQVPRANGGKRPNDLSVIDRWKILDNLRRSLLAPALLALFIAGWLWLLGSPLVWTLVGLLTLAIPLFTGVVAGLIRGWGGSWRSTPRGHAANTQALLQNLDLLRLSNELLHPIRNGMLRWLLSVAFLPYETVLSLNAILTTLGRLLITRRHLLQWTTAADTVRLFGHEIQPAVTWRKMVSSLIPPLALTLIISRLKPAALYVAMPLLLTWLLAPEIAYWISRPKLYEPAPLSAAQRQQLRRLARRTWLYFERFVGPEDHWLPPDHFQESPRGMAAHRTSPTNIGLMLISTLAAYDLGYMGPLGMVLQLRSTFESLDKLEKYRGHFLNWYDTGNLEPLPPRYVSTVDSGNLAACLLALKQGCLEIPGQPILRWQRWQGLIDTLDVLAEVVGELAQAAELEAKIAPLQAYLADLRQQILATPHVPGDWIALLFRLYNEGWQELNRLLEPLLDPETPPPDAEILRSMRIYLERVQHHLHNMQRELDLLLPWWAPVSQPPALFTHPATDAAVMADWQALVETLSLTPSLEEIVDICKTGQAQLTQLQDRLVDTTGAADEVQAAQAWCRHLAKALSSTQVMATALLIGYADLATQAEHCFQAMDFGFLFDRRRQVFHIGYNVTTGKLDNNYYDLLASEARTASLIAMAKAEVLPSHWLHLARPLTEINGSRTLLSWSGTMFEYLMPGLLMRSYEGTLLDQSCQAAIDGQMAYSQQHNVPWGISESGYYGFDNNLNYQYRAFGVPGLGFKRGLEEDLVVTPYASLLALSLQPQAVLENMDHLIELRLLGRYGFYEAIDYTRSRLSLGQKQAIVRSYMVHHQGMILVALTNYLQDESMIRRFHADLRVQSVDLLLQEQVPRQAPLEYPHQDEVSAVRPAEPQPAVTLWPAPVETPLPQVHFLSNGRYGVLITNAGGGYSRWQEVDLTRWRADTTLDNWGTWLYLQDQESGAFWPASFQPTAAPSQDQMVLFYPAKAEFHRRHDDISVQMEITIPPDEDLEIRRVTLTNHGERPRRLRLTSYGEVVLAPQPADARHPAFNKLFIESEYLPDRNALLFRRRPRSAKEEPLYLAHVLVVEAGHQPTGAYESDRARFLGRGGTPASPAALTANESWLSGTTGATLDPIMALGQEIELAAHSTGQVAYLTLVGRSRSALLALIDRYQAWSVLDRAFDQARAQSELELRHLDLSTPELERIQQLLSVLLYPHSGLRADPTMLAANTKGQSGLWGYAISGDYPILLVQVGSEEETALVLELLRAHTYWRNRQLKIDLVILNQHETGYAQKVQGQLHRLLTRTNNDAWLNQRGGIFLLRADQLSQADRALLSTTARAILDGSKGALANQLAGLQQLPTHLPPLMPTLTTPEDAEPTLPLARPVDLLFDNGWGGFSPDGREYIIYLKPGQWTPAPWINVIANPTLGFLVSEAGGGYTWAANSGENRLTPWSNDPVSDSPGEALYLRDEETGQVWSPTPLPARAPAPYMIRHGAGYTIFEHHSYGLKQRLRLFVAQQAPVKVVHLRLENTWSHTRRLTATFYAPWVLAAFREQAQQYIIPEYDAESYTLLARNPYNAEFGERVAFVTTNKKPHGLTADRTEFLGRMGSLSQPVALTRIGLTGTVKAGLDPCAAIQLHLDLPPGETEEIFFLIGQGADRAEALQLVKQYQDASQVEAAWQEVIKFWDDLLSTVTVRTPDPAMDLLLNRWLLYQDLACRVWGRSAFYQSSGAFGFRDQLQDVMALLHAAPEIAREHILRAACHQFEAGDVLHWWHPPSGRGVRTRISDDLLWLPFVTAYYVATTGDTAILHAKIPFLRGAPLEREEEERYGHYEVTAEGDTLYEHCRQALQKGTTAGPHGLPLMGGGDWNDGMNRVGIEGRGESVWLGWFLYATLTRFAPLAEVMGHEQQAASYRQQAQELRQALEATAWDGSWYLRAYYDDGMPLGSAANRECQIDAIAQSWAVLSGAGDSNRVIEAMEAVHERLIRPADRLILLFTPPFDKTPHDPGYIKGYLPGIRENGGQYTHAALWTVWAYAELGQGDRAEALFRLINPIYHADTPAKAAHYKVEPYVVAADVYGVPPHTGRGGWTWYTGSGGWMYRLGLEAILGLRRRGDVLQLEPCLPQHWPGYELTYRHGATIYHIQVDNPAGVNQGVKQVTLDGEVLAGEEIPLVSDGGSHRIWVLMG